MIITDQQFKDQYNGPKHLLKQELCNYRINEFERVVKGELNHFDSLCKAMGL